jgi:hypothetical protein
MNWIKEAEKELQNYKNTKTQIRSIPELIRNVDIEIASIKSTRVDSIPVSGGTNAREDWLIDKLMRKEELEMKKKIAEKHMDLVERGLNALDASERRVLELFYIDRPKDYIDRLCDELGYEQSNLYYHKNIALRKFTLAIYGVVDT